MCLGCSCDPGRVALGPSRHCSHGQGFSPGRGRGGVPWSGPAAPQAWPLLATCISRTSDQSVLPGQLVALPWEQEDREGGREGVIWVSCESTAHGWSSRSWEGRLSLLWGLGIRHAGGSLGTSAPDMVLPVGEELSLEDAGSVRYPECTLQAQEHSLGNARATHEDALPT